MRLHIFGASGSGVTTLGQHLSQHLSLLYFDTDAYHWVPTYPPFAIKRPAPERHAWLVSDLAKQDSWILGGTVYNWGITGEPPLIWQSICGFQRKFG